MKITRRTILAGSVIVILSGWLAFDLFDKAAGYYSPGGKDALVGVTQSPELGKTSSAAKQVQLASINPLSGFSLDSLKETIERPLFNQTRAPKPKPEPVVAQQQEEPGATAEDFTLLGVVVAEGGQTALIRYNKTNETFRLKAGQSFSDDWQVTDIGPKGVVVKNAELSFPLKLFTQPPQGGEPAQAGQQPQGQQPSDDDEESDDNSDDQPEAVSRLEQ